MSNPLKIISPSSSFMTEDPSSLQSSPRSSLNEHNRLVLAKPVDSDTGSVAALLPEDHKNEEEIEDYKTLMEGYNHERFLAKTPEAIDYSENTMNERFEKMKSKNT